METRGDIWAGPEPQPLNVFDWRIELPGVGPWRQSASKRQLVDLVKEIGTRSNIEVPDVESLITGEQCWLEVTSQGGHQTLSEHTLQHENHHVGDHRGLINNMLGPWDAFSEGHATQATALTRDDRGQLGAAFNTGSGWTPGANRIAAELGKEFQASGWFFHNTPAGAVPTITVKSVTEDTVTLDVSPQLLLTPGAIPAAGGYIRGKHKIGG